MPDGDQLILGELQNKATSLTRVAGNVDGNCVFRVDQEAQGNPGEAILALGPPQATAIFGFGGGSTTKRGGVGVAGQGGNGVLSEIGGVGVVGSGGGPTDNRGDGVWGVTNSPTGSGVFGFNFGLGAAVRGYSGVPNAGQRPSPVGKGIGVEGRSGSGMGVHGAASADEGIGVFAEHTGGGRGLAVKGRASFSACASGTISAGQTSKTVNDPAVRANSHITVTLTADPGVTAQVLWISRGPGSFTFHLTRSVQNATTFTYLIVEP